MLPPGVPALTAGARSLGAHSPEGGAWAGRANVAGRSTFSRASLASRLGTWGVLPRALAGPGRRAAWRRARLRRALAALLVGAMVLLLFDVFKPPAALHGSAVLVAARDLPAGSRLRAGDLTLSRWSESSRPRSGYGDMHAALGRRLSSPLTAGEAITSTRISGPGLLVGAAPDAVAAHVALADAAVTDMVRPGDTVDVLRTTDGAVVARAVTVLSVDSPDGADLLSGGGTGRPAGVVVAVSSRAASAMARAVREDIPGSGLSLTVHHPAG